MERASSCWSTQALAGTSMSIHLLDLVRSGQLAMEAIRPHAYPLHAPPAAIDAAATAGNFECVVLRTRNETVPQCFRVLSKKSTTDALSLVWNAVRSKPGALVQINGATEARAVLHGARKSKCPAFSTA